MRALQVYSREGCHLCEALIDELQPLIDGKLKLDVRDIDTNPEWHERWFMDIPVVEYEIRSGMSAGSWTSRSSSTRAR
jgi:hypothetical protein